MVVSGPMVVTATPPLGMTDVMRSFLAQVLSTQLWRLGFVIALEQRACSVLPLHLLEGNALRFSSLVGRFETATTSVWKLPNTAPAGARR
jgi:hypothetical protein